MSAAPVIFIRGTGRCGSKALINQLAEHPDLARVSVNEGLPEDLIDWIDLQAAHQARRVPPASWAAACRSFFESYARTLAEGRGILVQKSTMRAHRLARLLDDWPDCKIIYLVRHPIGFVESFINADIHQYQGSLGFQATVIGSALQWYNDIQAYLRSGACDHARVLRVHFEEFMRSPDRILGRIHDFIGVPAAAYRPATQANRYTNRFVLSEPERRWLIEASAPVVDQLDLDRQACQAVVPDQYRGLVGAHPERRITTVPPSLDGLELVRTATMEARECGYQRVGLLGAGYFARLICPHLQDLPVLVDHLFDENPALQGSRIGRFQVGHPESAEYRGVDAVIPLTFVYHQQLRRQWQRYYGDRIPVRPLWQGQPIQGADDDSVLGQLPVCGPSA